MSNTIGSGAPRINTSTPVPDEVVVPTTPAATDAAPAGFAQKSGFDALKTTGTNAHGIYKSATNIAEGVNKLASKALVGDEGARNAARTESLGVGDLSTAVGVAQDAHDMATKGVKLLAGEDAGKKFEDKTKGLGKTLNMASNAATIVSSDATTVQRAKAGVALASDAKDVLKLGETAATTIGVAGKLVGATAGVLNIEKNAVAAVDNFKKAASGDVKAGFAGVNNVVQVANNSLTVAKEVATGAKLLNVATQSAGTVLSIVEKAGPLTKRLPLVGAAIGTGVAAYNFAKEPTVMNGLKVAANAIGFIPGAGTVVSAVATTLLDHPEAVVKAAHVVADCASKAWGWVTGH